MSLQLLLAGQMIRFTLKRRFAKAPDVMTLRPFMAEGAESARLPPLPVRLDPVSLGGVMAERLSQPGSDESRAILYIHGGGFVAGRPANHRPLTWRLAKAANFPVYAIDYRLAPEHPFPAGLDDCVSAYRALLDKGIEPGHIAIGGDSAGGNLALATALRLKTEGLPQPGCLVCLSPVTDLTGPKPSHTENVKSDALFVAGTFDSVAPLYCPGQDPSNPLISPLHGDVHGLPRTLFQCSGAEMLRDDSIQMAAKMQNAGVAVELEIVPRVPHVWQILADFVPEARAAIDKIAAFIRERIGT